MEQSLLSREIFLRKKCAIRLTVSLLPFFSLDRSPMGCLSPGEISDEADQLRRRLPGGGDNRHLCQALGYRRQQNSRATDRGRQQARRRIGRGRGQPEEREAGRVYHRDPSKRGSSQSAHAKGSLRFGHGFYPDHAICGIRIRAGGSVRFALEDLQRIYRLRQGQPWKDPLQHGRAGNSSAPGHGTIGPEGEDQVDSYSFRGRNARHLCVAWRPRGGILPDHRMEEACGDGAFEASGGLRREEDERIFPMFPRCWNWVTTSRPPASSASSAPKDFLLRWWKRFIRPSKRPWKTRISSRWAASSTSR